MTFAFTKPLLTHWVPPDENTGITDGKVQSFQQVEEKFIQLVGMSRHLQLKELRTDHGSIVHR
jgi:hypothetical protein